MFYRLVITLCFKYFYYGKAKVKCLLAYMILRQKKVSFLQLPIPSGGKVLCMVIN